MFKRKPRDSAQVQQSGAPVHVAVPAPEGDGLVDATWARAFPGGTSADDFDHSMSPWARAQKAYDDRQMRLAAHARNWQRAFLTSQLLSVLMVGVVAYAVHIPKMKPAPIAIDQLGRSMLITSDQPEAVLRARQEYRETIDFIENCRTVIADKMGLRKIQERCYSRLPDDSAARKWVLSQQSGDNDPFVIAQDHSVEPSVTTALKLSDGNWEVEWSEQSINQSGAKMGPPVKYKGHLTDQFIPGDSEKALRQNPSGYYVQTLSWAKIL